MNLDYVDADLGEAPQRLHQSQRQKAVNSTSNFR